MAPLSTAGKARVSLAYNPTTGSAREAAKSCCIAAAKAVREAIETARTSQQRAARRRRDLASS